MQPTASHALRLLKASDRTEMWEAAKAPVRAEERGVIVDLIDLVDRPGEPEGRAAAAWILGSLRAREATHCLAQILADKLQPAVVREALGYLADCATRETIVANLSDENADVVLSCVRI
jgi:HEAT repeat protein